MQTIEITAVQSTPPSAISSNVPHPTGGLSVITIGEEMAFRTTLILPVSTNDDFTVTVYGQGFDGVSGKITRVGNNIQSLHGQIRGAGKCKIKGVKAATTCTQATFCL